MPAHDDPRQAIIDVLSAPGGMGAKTETICFLKERQLPGRQLHYLSYEDGKGCEMNSTCYVVQFEQGLWYVRGFVSRIRGGKELVREQPWVKLTGGRRGLKEFYASGRVMTNGLDIMRVRLRAANGTILEDTVDDEVVLFLNTQAVEMPLQAEFYDRQGVLVGSHVALTLPPRPSEPFSGQVP